MEIVLGEIGSKSILLVNDLIIPFEDSVIYSKNSDSISIKLNNTNKELFNTIKREFIKVVHKNSKKIFGTHKSINIIEELYCNPYKITPTGDFFEINVDREVLLPRVLSGNICISKLWNGTKSFGPSCYLMNNVNGNLNNVNNGNNGNNGNGNIPKNNFFIESESGDSDSDSDIHY